MSTNEDKKELRKKIKVIKGSFSEDQLCDKSIHIMQKLEESDLFRLSSRIGCYHALKDEVQTKYFLDKWYKIKQIYIPVVDGDDMEFFLYQGPDSVQVGDYGILEPKDNSRKLDKENIDMIIVPGIAFDKNKNRLGRGKGYYDKYLSKLNIPFVGICFDFQLLDEIPTETFDRKMDMVITDKIVIV